MRGASRWCPAANMMQDEPAHYIHMGVTRHKESTQLREMNNARVIEAGLVALQQLNVVIAVAAIGMD